MCWEDFVTPDDRKRAQRIREIETYIALAGELSISVINTFTGPMTWRANHETVGRDLSEGRAWSLVVDSFSKILETAEKNEVTVTLEAVFGMLVHDYYTVKEFLSYFASKHMAVNLDPAWALQMLGSKVRHVHVKDVVGRPGTFGADFIFAFLGEGNVDWKAFFSTLKKIGYSGFLSLEFENDVYLNNVCNGDWRIAARESKTRLHKLLRETGKPG
jgi:sugar phosphate isomerase/epimerase